MKDELGVNGKQLGLVKPCSWIDNQFHPSSFTLHSL
jgi:hypothetical protein